LVAHLQRLADPERRDRAALARLRAALRPGRELEALREVLPYVHELMPRAEDAALLTAGLFSLHPHHRSGTTLATALRRLAAGQEGDSVEQRFQALLSASRHELSTHLRYAVGLVAGQPSPSPIDYTDLHAAIYWWDHPEGRSRRRWARDFWAPRGSGAAETDPARPDSSTTSSL